MFNGTVQEKSNKRIKLIKAKLLINLLNQKRTYFAFPNIGDRPMITEAKADLTC